MALGPLFKSGLLAEVDLKFGAADVPKTLSRKEALPVPLVIESVVRILESFLDKVTQSGNQRIVQERGCVKNQSIIVRERLGSHRARGDMQCPEGVLVPCDASESGHGQRINVGE